MIIPFWVPSITFLIVAIWMRVLPPKGINYVYGYRTVASMKDEASWKKANDYSSKYLLIIAISIFVFQILMSLLFGITKTILLISGVLLVSSWISLFIMTERQLKK